MAFTKMVNVDAEKIQKVLVRKNMKMKDMGIAMGHDYTYISVVIRRGTMSKSDAVLFKQLYGTDIVVEDEVLINRREKNETVVPLDYNKLGIIAQSVIDYDKLAEAMSKVIDYDRLSEIICKAMIQALDGEPDKPTFEKRTLE